MDDDFVFRSFLFHCILFVNYFPLYGVSSSSLQIYHVHRRSVEYARSLCSLMNTYSLSASVDSAACPRLLCLLVLPTRSGHPRYTRRYVPFCAPTWWALVLRARSFNIAVHPPNFDLARPIRTL